MQQNEDNLLDILRIVFRRKKFIITTCGIVAIGTVIIVLFLPNYYEAKTSFYPASNALLDPNRLFGESDEGVEYFGAEEEVNQILSAAESKKIIDETIKEFDLYNVYKIDTTKREAPHKVRKNFLKHYQVLKNENDGIDLSVEDTDRQRAADMANFIRYKVDLTHRSFVKQNQEIVIKTHEKSLNDRTRRMNEISDSLVKWRGKYQIYNIDAQSEFLSSYVPKIQSELAAAKAKLSGFKVINQRDSVRMYEVKIRGFESQLNTLTTGGEDGTSINLKSLKEGMTKILALELEQDELTEEIAKQRELYLRYQNILSSDVSSLLAVETADVPIIKSRPVRSIIVIVAVVIAFVLSVTGVLVFENYRHIDWKAIYRGE
jgi:tyrosine-protein kinase Etk/Wzc